MLIKTQTEHQALHKNNYIIITLYYYYSYYGTTTTVHILLLYEKTPVKVLPLSESSLDSSDRPAPPRGPFMLPCTRAPLLLIVQK